MSKIRFDQASIDAPRGLRRVVVPIRRGMARILRPMLVQMADALQSFSSRLDRIEQRSDEIEGRQALHNDQLQATISFGWDYVASVRRLAALEDQVALCLAQSQTSDADGQMTLPFSDASEPRARAS